MPYYNQKMHMLSFATFLFLFTHSPVASAAGTPSDKDWFLLEVNGKAQAYYSEFIVREPKKSLITVQEWKVLEGIRGESTVRTATLDDEFLTPVSLDTHFRSKDGKKEHKLEVTMKANGKWKDLEYRFRAIRPLPSRKKKQHMMPKEPLFYSSLPRYLARLNPGLHTVTAIMEDVPGVELAIRLLRLNRMTQTRQISGRTCLRSVVDLNGSEGDMWVTEEGRLCEFTVPAAKTRIVLATEAELKKADPGRKRF